MIVNINEAGRLGNQIIQHAQMLAFAKENQTSFLNLAFSDSYTSYFEGTVGIKLVHFTSGKRMLLQIIPHKYLLKFFNRPFRLLSKIWPFSYVLFYHKPRRPGIFNLSDMLPLPGVGNITVLNGWQFKGPNLLQKHKQWIQEYFKPVPQILNEVDAVISRCRIDDSVVVGCHIRRGDYRTFRSGEYYFELEDYYKIMLSIQKLRPNKTIKFLVCSDEKIDLNHFAQLDCVEDYQSGIVDMYSLAQCDYILGPPSTFSTWASFWGQVPRYEMHKALDCPHLEDFEIYN